MTAAAENLFLSSLSPRARDMLTVHAVAVPLPVRMVLYEAGAPPSSAFFLTSGIASVVTAMTDGSTSEVGMHGRESLTGGLQVLGTAPNPMNCFMQMEGTALRIPFADLRQCVQTSDEIRNAVLARVQIEAMVMGQVAGCNRLHEAVARLARWLLMARDRHDTDILTFTQEFLAEMLGARRATVTMVAGSMQRSGLIEYQRGRVRIVDRAKLEKAACACYGIIQRLSGASLEQRSVQ